MKVKHNRKNTESSLGFPIRLIQTRSKLAYSTFLFLLKFIEPSTSEALWTQVYHNQSGLPTALIESLTT